MKIAILGPVCKDSITVNATTNDQLGGIPYYAGIAMKNLGVDITAFITYGEKDDAWVKSEFSNVKIEHIPASDTLHFLRTYSSENPDLCLSVKIDYFPNSIEPQQELLKKLQNYDYIILSPLLTDNISPETFKLIKEHSKKPIVHGNFGMFSYAINNEFIQKNPENFIAAAPFIDYLFLDEKEVVFATITKTVGEAVKKLQDLGIREIIVTKGSRGSTIHTKIQTYDIPAYQPKEIVDPTGAGDTYLGAYITAQGLFEDPVARGKFAAMTATISLEKRGAFSGSKEEVIKRLREQGENV